MNQLNPAVAESADIATRLAFANQLQALSNQIHATRNIDEIMLDLARDICELFVCERLTLYAIAKERNILFSKVKTGINSNKDLVLPLDLQSVAGFVALKRRLVCVADVYDPAQLAAISPELHFFDKVDQVVAFRSKQMLAAPIVNAASQQLLGVIQLLNTRNDLPFSPLAQQGLQQLCETLAVAFSQRISQPLAVCSKYQSLVVDSIISEAELELAARWARRKELDIEEVLQSEYQVPLAVIGQALAKHYRVVYEPYESHRSLSPKLRDKLDRETAQQQQWLPIAEERIGLTVLTTDPAHANDSGQIQKLFPYPSLFFRVTTKREFAQTLDLLFAR